MPGPRCPALGSLPSLPLTDGRVCSSAHSHQRPPPSRPLSSSRPPRTKPVIPGDRCAAVCSSRNRLSPLGVPGWKSLLKSALAAGFLFLAVAPHSYRYPGLNLPGSLALPLPLPPTSNRAQNLVIPSLKRVLYSFLPVNSYYQQPRPDLGQLCSHRGSRPASASSGLPANYL